MRATMARVLLAACVLAVGLALGRTGAGAEAGAEQVKAESPAVVTLRTLITGSCQEVQRYAESVLGAGVIRSTAEVQSEGAQPGYTPFFLTLTAPRGFSVNSLS